MATPQVRTRGYCLTINNYTQDDEDRLRRVIDEQCTYGIYGKEIGEQCATPHLQSYIQFVKKVDFNKVKKLFPTAHIELAKGTAKQNRTYCSKEGKVYEKGQIVESGDKFKQIVDYIDTTPSVTYTQLLRLYPAICARYKDYVQDLLDSKQQAQIKKTAIEQPYPWQSTMITELTTTEPHDRHIIWIYDKKGNNGKTHLAKYLVDNHNAFYTNGGKHADILYAYKGQPIVILDYPRDSEEYVSYGMIEQLKNGIFFSPKYESQMKRFNTPHVVVMANFKPDTTKMSRDRWDIREVTSKKFKTAGKPANKVINMLDNIAKQLDD